MAFNKKDSVLVLMRRDTGEVHGPGDQQQIYNVFEDTQQALGLHHEEVLRHLPCKHTIRSDTFTYKVEGYVENGYRTLEITCYSGGLLRALGGRIAPTQRRRFKISS